MTTNKFFLIAIIVISLLQLYSCARKQEMKKNPELYKKISSSIYEIKIDSCEYICYNGNCIIHKANCSNPIHSK